nr:Lrp/AsnC ligand binding domain-containing protein [Halarchaeum solikamskense]
MVALTQVTVVHESGYSDALGARLSAVSGVEQVYYTMGDVDFVLVVRVQDREQMNDVIEEVIAIDGVNQTSSRFVMDEIRGDEGTVENLREDALEALRGGD